MDLSHPSPNRSYGVVHTTPPQFNRQITSPAVKYLKRLRTGSNLAQKVLNRRGHQAFHQSAKPWLIRLRSRKRQCPV